MGKFQTLSIRSWRSSVRLGLIAEDDKVRLLLPAEGEESLSKGDLLTSHLCLVVLLTALFNGPPVKGGGRSHPFFQGRS